VIASQMLCTAVYENGNNTQNMVFKLVSPLQAFKNKKAQIKRSFNSEAEAIKNAKNEIVQHYELFVNLLTTIRNDEDVMFQLFSDIESHFKRTFWDATHRGTGISKKIGNIYSAIDIYEFLLSSKRMVVNLVKALQKALDNPKREIENVYKQVYGLAQTSRVDLLSSLTNVKKLSAFIDCQVFSNRHATATFKHNLLVYNQLEDNLKPLVKLLSLDELELLTFEDVDAIKAYVEALDDNNETATSYSLFRLQEFVFYIRALLHLAPFNFPETVDKSLGSTDFLFEVCGVDFSITQRVKIATLPLFPKRNGNYYAIKEFKDVRYDREQVFKIFEQKYFPQWGLVLNSTDERFMKEQIKKLNNPNYKPKKKKSKKKKVNEEDEDNNRNIFRVIEEEDDFDKNELPRGIVEPEIKEIKEILIDKEIKEIFSDKEIFTDTIDKVQDEIQIEKQKKSKVEIQEQESLKTCIVKKVSRKKSKEIPRIECKQSLDKKQEQNVTKKGEETKDFILRTLLDAILNPVSEIRWKDFVQIMTNAGFETIAGTGSGYKFVLERKGERFPLIVHRPHPNPKFRNSTLINISKDLKGLLDRNKDSKEKIVVY
jgi:hypothetical protein